MDNSCLSGEQQVSVATDGMIVSGLSRQKSQALEVVT